MSVMTKIQEALAANPGVSWNDLVLRRLRTATSSTDGALNDLWMRWLAAAGHTQNSLQDRMAAYWRANNTPLAERNAFYFGYTAFFGVQVPGAPTSVSALAGDGQAVVSFTAPVNDGGSPITGYRVTASPGSIVATGASSPITVTGLTNGTAYTFTVEAQNASGYGPPSIASASVTPSASLNNDPSFLDPGAWITSGSFSITGGQAVKVSGTTGFVAQATPWATAGTYQITIDVASQSLANQAEVQFFTGFPGGTAVGTVFTVPTTSSAGVFVGTINLPSDNTAGSLRLAANFTSKTIAVNSMSVVRL